MVTKFVMVLGGGGSAVTVIKVVGVAISSVKEIISEQRI
jgi:hypothetical protein